MTTSTEPSRPAPAGDGPLGAAWRAEAERAQRDALPPGRVVVSCSAPFGAGGLGRHCREIVAALDRGGQPRVCLCGSAPASDPSIQELPVGRPGKILARLASPSPAWRTWAASVAFDRRAARALPASDHLIAFNGQAVAQMEAARSDGCESVSLVAANSHLRQVVRQHAKAYARYPFDRSWAPRLLGRNLVEYARADRIYVATRYIWESFVEAGFSEESLSPLPLTPDPRYGSARERAAGERAASGTFDVVYVGSLTVAKGVPLLVEAFGRIAHADMRLLLVGGWGTRGMRRFVERACARDPRIAVRPGDPLPHLRGARLYVHPAYEDGFAYAPAEALACGVPVIVSEDTGMKELISSAGEGVVVPTGDLDALTEAIGAAYAGEILDG
ncbi:MAG TPA: glycosyltransferase family 4 protein [Solirubrobacteraceae bacterium]|nr:glycosyltransferase family 4 protein [Solirubrobacteraceae bacterium]